MRSVFMAVALVGCTASSEEVRPPPDQLFFPTGAAVSPDERFLFVSNANSELRYDSGTVSVIDLEEIDRVAAEWVATGGVSAPDCAIDPDHRETLACANESHFIIADASARIGNFATDIAVQDTGNGTLRLIVPTRGDPSIAWLDFDGSKLGCNDSNTQGFALCDEGHRLAYVHNDPDLALVPDEPFDAYADSSGQYAVVTHLTSGAVTLIDSPVDGDARVADVMAGLFAADPASGLRGATGIAARNGGIIYVASRSEDRVQTLTVGRPVNGADPFLLAGNYFFLNLVGSAPSVGSSNDTRGLAFSANGDRMYLINRRPPSLQIFDTSAGPTGFPKNEGIAATDICRGSSTLAVTDTGDGDRAYITCFQDGQVYVVDPRGLSSVENIVTVGRGPYSVVAAPNRKKIYVTNFLEDTVVVMDVSPTSKYYNRVVLRIGDVRPL